MTANMERSFVSATNFETTPRNSGDFLSREIDNPVKSMHVTYEDETPDAIIHERRVIMADGTRYKMAEVMPKRPKVDVINLRTPAWTTSWNKGYERHYALEMAKIGVANICVSPQQYLLKIGNMTNNAHDYVEAALVSAYEHDMDTEHLTAGGSSRGGMFSKAIARVSPDHGAETESIDSLGACMPNGIILEEMPRALGKLSHEPGRLLQIIMHDPLGYTRVLASTITTDAVEMYQHGKEIVSLVDGSTGKNTDGMPLTTAGFVQQFTSDGLAFHESWPKRLDPFPHIQQRVSPGTHMDCIAPWNFRQSIERARHIRDGHIGGAVGGSALFLAVIDGNPAFQGGFIDSNTWPSAA